MNSTHCCKEGHGTLILLSPMKTDSMPSLRQGGEKFNFLEEPFAFLRSHSKLENSEMPGKRENELEIVSSASSDVLRLVIFTCEHGHGTLCPNTKAMVLRILHLSDSIYCCGVTPILQRMPQKS